MARVSLQNSVVLISGRDEKNKRFGSGFAIYRDKDSTYVLTCAHVVKDVGGEGGVEQIYVNDQPGQVITSGSEEGIDLAILRVRDLQNVPVLSLSINAQEGLPFLTAGFQLFVKVHVLRSIQGTLIKQVIAHPRYGQQRVTMWEFEVDGADNSIEPGFSGAPLVNPKTNSVFALIAHRQGEGERGVGISLDALKEIWGDMPQALKGSNQLSEVIEASQQEVAESLQEPSLSLSRTGKSAETGNDQVAESLQEPSLSLSKTGKSAGAGNDQVAEKDHLGFLDYVKAFADLIESSYTNPPITIGIFGTWGMGKSFLLEHIGREIKNRQESRKLEIFLKDIEHENLNDLQIKALLAVYICSKINCFEIRCLKRGNLTRYRGKNALKVQTKILGIPILPERRVFLNSTVMAHLQNYLLAVDKATEKVINKNDPLFLNPRELPKSVKPLSLAKILKIIKKTYRNVQPPLEKQQLPFVHIVDFNAWEYSATTVIWPGLVRKIMDQIEKDVTWHFLDRFKLKFWQNFKRQLQQLESQIIILILIITTISGLTIWHFNASFSTILGAIIAIGLGGLSKIAIDTLTNPLSKWITTLFQRSDYGRHIGVMSEIRDDLELLAERLSQSRSRILVIIDDLDRCEPGKAVEVLQAIKLLLNFDSFIVCLGIDARIITAAVEKYYENLLGSVGASGYEYLDKIVQIPFSIPRPDIKEVERFIATQIENSQVLENLQPIQSLNRNNETTNRDEEILNKEIIIQIEEDAMVHFKKLSNSQSSTFDLGQSKPLTVFTKDELEAFQKLSYFLKPNPRHLKRLINIYRLVRTLAEYKIQQKTEKNYQEIPDKIILDKPFAVIRWLAIFSQWPYTANAMLSYFNGMLRLKEERGLSEFPPFIQQEEPLNYLFQKVSQYLANEPEDNKKQKKLDYDMDLLRMILRQKENEKLLNWNDLIIIRSYTVNFNPAIETDLNINFSVATWFEEG